MASARSLFAAKGYESATIRQIASAAGFSTGAVFASFVDKSELLIAIIDIDRQVLSETMRVAAVGETLEARLLAMFTAGYQVALPDLPLLQNAISVSWCPRQGAGVRSRLSRWPTTELVSAVLTAAIEQDEASCQTDVPLISQMLWDCFLANLRHAAFEDWNLDDLTSRLRDQIRVLLGLPRSAPADLPCRCASGPP
jgi:AcrR family transcriptional regulator